jgi:hypothetical protein
MLRCEVGSGKSDLMLLSESSLIASRAVAMEYSLYEKVKETTGDNYRARKSNSPYVSVLSSLT